MLFIHMENHDEIQWRVGEFMPLADVDIGRNVVFIQADSDELEYILHKFGMAAICPAGCSQVKWFGDTAKFIVGNL